MKKSSYRQIFSKISLFGHFFFFSIFFCMEIAPSKAKATNNQGATRKIDFNAIEAETC